MPAALRERRLRLTLPGLFGDDLRESRVQRDLARVPGVIDVRANARTGRVLLIVSGDALPPEARAALDALALPEAPAPPSLRGALRGALGLAGGLVRHARARVRGDEAPGAVELDHGPAWHALPAEEVVRVLHADPRAGLTTAAARQELRRVGPNELAGVEPRSPLQILAGQIFTIPTAMLAGASGLSLLLGDVLEAGAVLLVVASNAAIGYFTESRAEELLHAWADLRVEWARVVRDGREVSLAASEVVPGDTLILRAGEEIPADARVIDASELAADESLLTGESEPAEKSVDACPRGAAVADRRCMVHAGTLVASGEGRAVVVATGQRTELGNVQRALSRAGERAAPLEQELGRIGQSLAGFALASSVAVIGIGLLRGQPLRALAQSAVALGVAAIPEGFPAVGTTALALASRRLHRRGIVIRRLAAAETLGAVSVVCADKTGTLTENRMRVAEVLLPGERLIRVEDGAAPRALATQAGDPVDPADVRALARIAALNADVDITEAGTVTRGSGTERALVEFAVAAGYPVPERRQDARRIGEERRSVGRPYMTTFHDHPELGHIELVKGAPEQVVPRCEDLGESRAAEVLRHNEAMASRGLRVLAFAWRKNGTANNTAPLSFAGLVGLRDPARPGVREALDRLSRAGITTLMLTGDQERTARAIGEALGIPPENVHSRVTPEAKLAVVQELQRRGAIVAMTGDGVNDGPALKAADVGVAMGQRGTDLARAVADVVLAHDDLPSLTEAVCEGRRLYDNVRRAIDYFVATNTSEVLVMLVGSAVGAAPLRPLQLLWINLLTDVAPALALALEPAEPGIMSRPPRDPAAPLYSGADLRRLGRDASLMAGASLGAYGLGALAGGRGRGSSMAFTSLVVAQLLHIHACRAAQGAATAERNPHLSRAMLATFGLQALALGAPSLRGILSLQALRGLDIAAAAAVGVLPSLLRDGARASLLGQRHLITVRAARGDAQEELALPPLQPLTEVHP